MLGAWPKMGLFGGKEIDKTSLVVRDASMAEITLFLGSILHQNWVVKFS
jgi:hypothetical protein